ncbi:hypothetical protein JOE61_003503 [Nocardioides salarius]|uniref:Uncharacterized protein n=1 Tax=Nocardioides salarius TaxID=374513 RepID=A0ABS2MER9_9ACTN|nr:hypothetical protein [Nocardioides salarius]
MGSPDALSTSSPAVEEPSLGSPPRSPRVPLPEPRLRRAPGLLQPARGRRRAGGALLRRLRPGGGVAGGRGRPALVVRRHRLAAADRAPHLGTAGPGCRAADRTHPALGAGRQHLALLPAAGHQRRRRRAALPALARQRPADGRPAGRRLLPDGPRDRDASAHPAALLAPHRSVGGAGDRQGGADPVAAADPDARDLRAGQERLDARHQRAGRGRHGRAGRLRRRARGPARLPARPDGRWSPRPPWRA